MKWIYYISIFYLGVFTILAAFPLFTRWHWLVKLAVALLALVALTLSIAYQHIEKKSEERNEQISEMRDEQRAQVINQKLDALVEKDKKGLLTDKDYLNRISLELEKLNLGLRAKEGAIKEPYLATYFNVVSKIPDFYSWDEWKDTENIIFQKMDKQMSGFFANRGTLDSGIVKALFEEFKSEREKCIKAKERQFKK